MQLYPDLDACFVQYLPPTLPDLPSGGFRRVDTLEEAQGLWFQCPACAEGCLPAEDGLGVQGAHYVLCWFRNPSRCAPVGPEVEPGPGRWWVTGTGLHDLTFEHGVPPLPKSVQLTGGCNFHGYVTAGTAVVG